MNISPILTDIKKRKFQPVYLLHGEESYFIDVISDALEHTVLNDAQKGFDQTVLYGKDTDFSTIVNAAKRYPMMSDHQLIIIKEAQDLKWKDDELIIKYVEQCTVSTVLVFDYKYGKFDKRKKLYKAIEKKGLVVESNKLNDDKVAAWVISYIKEQGWNIHPHAAALLSEYLGTELSKIVNELNKLMLNVPKENTNPRLKVSCPSHSHSEGLVSASSNFISVKLRHCFGEDDVFLIFCKNWIDRKLFWGTFSLE